MMYFSLNFLALFLWLVFLTTVFFFVLPFAFPCGLCYTRIAYPVERPCCAERLSGQDRPRRFLTMKVLKALLACLPPSLWRSPPPCCCGRTKRPALYPHLRQRRVTACCRPARLSPPSLNGLCRPGWGFCVFCGASQRKNTADGTIGGIQI